MGTSFGMSLTGVRLPLGCRAWTFFGMALTGVRFPLGCRAHLAVAESMDLRAYRESEISDR